MELGDSLSLGRGDNGMDQSKIKEGKHFVVVGCYYANQKKKTDLAEYTKPHPMGSSAS